MKQLQRLKEPFYSILITLTSHYPYDVQDAYKELDVSGYEDPIFMNYLHTILYLAGVTDQTYMMGRNIFLPVQDRVVIRCYGAFFTDAFVYIPSESLKFTEGSCYQKPEYEKVDINACKPGDDFMMKELEISDTVVHYNLLKKIDQPS